MEICTLSRIWCTTHGTLDSYGVRRCAGKAVQEAHKASKTVPQTDTGERVD